MEPQQSQECHEVRMTAGLIGFEEVKRYRLVQRPEEAPFQRLQMAEGPGLDFLVVPASEIVENYHPDIPEDEIQSLGLKNPEEALVLSIVTLHPDGQATANLRGPIVVNRRSFVAKQVIPRNATRFPLAHRLLLNGNGC